MSALRSLRRWNVNEAGVLVEPPVRKAVHYIVRMYKCFIGCLVHTASPGLEKPPTVSLRSRLQLHFQKYIGDPLGSDRYERCMEIVLVKGVLNRYGRRQLSVVPVHDWYAEDPQLTRHTSCSTKWICCLRALAFGSTR